MPIMVSGLLISTDRLALSGGSPQYSGYSQGDSLFNGDPQSDAFGDFLRVNKPLSGEKMLAAAVLLQAKADREIGYLEELWLYENSEYLYSLQGICSYLELDAKAVRTAILKVIPKPKGYKYSKRGRGRHFTRAKREV